MDSDVAGAYQGATSSFNICIWPDEVRKTVHAAQVKHATGSCGILAHLVRLPGSDGICHQSHRSQDASTS